MSDLFVDNIKHQSSQGSGTITLGASGETIALASGAQVSGFTGQNYPAFEAIVTSNQLLTDDTWVKVTFEGEIYDTNNAFTLGTFTVPSGQDGKYCIYSTLRLTSSQSNDIADAYLGLYKNGVLFRYSQFSTLPSYTLPSLYS